MARTVRLASLGICDIAARELPQLPFGPATGLLCLLLDGRLPSDKKPEPTARLSHFLSRLLEKLARNRSDACDIDAGGLCERAVRGPVRSLEDAILVNVFLAVPGNLVHVSARLGFCLPWLYRSHIAQQVAVLVAVCVVVDHEDIDPRAGFLLLLRRRRGRGRGGRVDGEEGGLDADVHFIVQLLVGLLHCWSSDRCRSHPLVGILERLNYSIIGISIHYDLRMFVLGCEGYVPVVRTWFQAASPRRYPRTTASCTDEAPPHRQSALRSLRVEKMVGGRKVVC
ncbi:hypothetical protein ABW21_db0203359 [Orbilia brochopaga]|nr:hypothetical protein ABW21_db0203359 [Drechslerella brochopaga]